jgi:hypothetical protein
MARRHPVFNSGALAFLGILPTRRRVREIVRGYLRQRTRGSSGF